MTRRYVKAVFLAGVHGVDCCLYVLLMSGGVKVSSGGFGRTTGGTSI